MDALTLPPAPVTVTLSEDGRLVDSFGSFSSSANPQWPQHRGVGVRLESWSVVTGTSQRSVQPCPRHPDRDRLQRQIGMT